MENMHGNELCIWSHMRGFRFVLLFGAACYFFVVKLVRSCVICLC